MRMPSPGCSQWRNPQMAQTGVPDFQESLQGEGFHIFLPYEGRGKAQLEPSRLDVAQRDDGHPDFLLELIRGPDPTLPPAPYGMLDLKVQPYYPVTEALALLRGSAPDLLLDPVVFSSGFLRIGPSVDVD